MKWCYNDMIIICDHCDNSYNILDMEIAYSIIVIFILIFTLVVVCCIVRNDVNDSFLCDEWIGGHWKARTNERKKHYS